jgi:hypothetical protein
VNATERRCIAEGKRGLKREVSPAEVWGALKLAMEGQNESARVGASRVLMDALAEPRDGCPECEARRAEAPDIEARLVELLARSEPERKRTVRAVVHEELAAVAEQVDVSTVEQRLVDRL